MQPLVPGFIITGELSSGATGSTWAAVRSQDDHRFVLNVIPVTDAMEALTMAAQLMAHLDRIDSEHLVRQHDAIALADGTLALVLEEVTGGSLAHLLGARGQLTAGETVTTVAPLCSGPWPICTRPASCMGTWHREASCSAPTAGR